MWGKMRGVLSMRRQTSEGEESSSGARVNWRRGERNGVKGGEGSGCLYRRLFAKY